MENGQFFQWSWKYKGNRLNKDIKKENFTKDLMNVIETNYEIYMTSIIQFQAATHLKSICMLRVLTCF